MNRIELVTTLAEKHELSKAEAGRVLDTVLESIVSTVRKGGTVSLVGFGTFKQSSRAARTGRNPQSAEVHGRRRLQSRGGPEVRQAQGRKGSCSPEEVRQEAGGEEGQRRQAGPAQSGLTRRWRRTVPARHAPLRQARERHFISVPRASLERSGVAGVSEQRPAWRTSWLLPGVSASREAGVPSASRALSCKRSM